MKKFNVGISCIGSGVGQSVINSCRLARLPIRTIGIGTNPYAYGLYDCDKYIYAPSIYAEGYADVLLEKCLENKIDLLIPGHDDEALFLSRDIHKFTSNGIRVIVSGVELLEYCRDKERMSNELSQVADIFVKSYDKASFLKAYQSGEAALPVICKPRDGYASKGISIVNTEEDFHKMTDGFIIQEIAIPFKDDPNRTFYLDQLKKGNNPQVSEISIQIVTDKDGDLIGKMISYNKLNNGVPIEIIPIEGAAIWEQVDKLLPVFKKLGLRGPVNLQGRMTERGLRLFEMNSRFTGITSLRALMGFNEVEACIKSWLELPGQPLSLKINYNRIGIRQTADRAVYINRNKEAKNLYTRLNNGEVKKKKDILVTGSTGYLGRNFVSEIMEGGAYSINLLVRDKQKARDIFNDKGLKLFNQTDLEDGNLALGNIETLIHIGFARPHLPPKEIADSLRFTLDLFTKAAMNHVPEIINISTQGVYGQAPIPWSEESSEPQPLTPYAQAKLATEIALSNMRTIYSQLRYTNIRMGAISGGQDGLLMTDFLAKMVKNCLEGQDLIVKGGNQIFERIDVRDAASALQAILQGDSQNWSKVYNVGSGQPITLSDWAKLVSNSSKSILGKDVNIFYEAISTQMNFSLDNAQMMKDFSWTPKIRPEELIDSLFKFLSLK